jgi:hypothetical protein
MTSSPKMYQVWLTKHLLDFCSNNVQQYYWSNGIWSPKCNFCGDHNEFTTHISQCCNPGCNDMFQISLQKVYNWMAKTLGGSTLSLTVKTYLLGRGLVLMESCVNGNDETLLNLAQSSNRLGWDRFIEGRISVMWLSGVSPILSLTCPHLPIKSWGRQFITKLHNVVHKQRIYRNTLIHCWGKDGLTIPEHHKIINHIEECSSIDPKSLLPRHCHLFGTDFETLGSGPTAHHLL